jgi:hypothetical protein
MVVCLFSEIMTGIESTSKKFLSLTLYDITHVHAHTNTHKHKEILTYREMSSSLTARGVDACRAIDALSESEYGIGVSKGAAKQLKQL